MGIGRGRRGDRRLEDASSSCGLALNNLQYQQLLKNRPVGESRFSSKDVPIQCLLPRLGFHHLLPALDPRAVGSQEEFRDLSGHYVPATQLTTFPSPGPYSSPSSSDPSPSSPSSISSTRSISSSSTILSKSRERLNEISAAQTSLERLIGTDCASSRTCALEFS